MAARRTAVPAAGGLAGVSDAVDPKGVEARVRDGVVHLRLPKAGPAKLQRIEVRAD